MPPQKLKFDNPDNISQRKTRDEQFNLSGLHSMDIINNTYILQVQSHMQFCAEQREKF